MKVATFNINNVNKRLANLVALARAAKPDVVCLQELKAADHEFPKAAIEKAGVMARFGADSIVVERRRYLARGSEPIVTRSELPGDRDDKQARYIEAAVNGVLVWHHFTHPTATRSQGLNSNTSSPGWIVSGGTPPTYTLRACRSCWLRDYNVVPTDRDIFCKIPTPRMRCCSPEHASGLRICSTRAGATLYVQFQSRHADVHVFGLLFAESLAAGCRAPMVFDFSVAQQRGSKAVGRRRGRSRGSRR